MSFIRVGGGFVNLDKVVLATWAPAQAHEVDEMLEAEAKEPQAHWPEHIRLKIVLILTFDGGRTHGVPWRDTSALLDALVNW